jgi:hypothetical protein
MPLGSFVSGALAALTVEDLDRMLQVSETLFDTGDRRAAALRAVYAYARRPAWDPPAAECTA